jgi:predicted XRE-type DNA-binding protein
MVKHKVEESCGNIFEDLGMEDPEKCLVKAELARKISVAIEEMGLTQAAAAALLGVDQPTLSAIVRGRLQRYSVDKLMRLLTGLGYDLEIVITEPKGQQMGHLSVHA